MSLKFAEGRRRKLVIRYATFLAIVVVWFGITIFFVATGPGHDLWSKITSTSSKSKPSADTALPLDTDFSQIFEGPYLTSVNGSAATTDEADHARLNNLKTLIAPYLVRVDAPEFLTPDGQVYEVPNRRWRKHLGRRLCIVDVDTRPFNGTNQVWSQEYITWGKVKAPDFGRLNHYAYALIHGYNYRYIQVNEHENWFSPWQRIPVLAELLRSYDVVVYADADVVYANMHLPFELLFNYWEVDPGTAITMPRDIVGRPFKDSRGKQTTNAGFQILTNSNTTFDLLERWYDCPNVIKGCEKYISKWPAEQWAYNEYIRDQFADSVGEIPCEDVLGWPTANYKMRGCNGRLIRHYTLKKEKTKDGVEESFSLLLSTALQAAMNALRGEIRVDINVG